MADKRAYFKVDVGYFTNPKVAAVLAESPTAIILHLESVAYAAQHLTDGLVPSALVQRMVGATSEDAGLLLDAGMWIQLAKGHVMVHDYLEHQRSAAEAKKLSDAGRKAAATRWESDSQADGNADSNADRMRSPMPREKEREKRENTTPAAIAAEFEGFWDVYPRKVDRARAAKAYAKARKTTEAATIIAGITRQLPWFASQLKAEGDFRPHASTWLNGERWGDAPVVPLAQRPDRAHLPEAWR